MKFPFAPTVISTKTKKRTLESEYYGCLSLSFLTSKEDEFGVSKSKPSVLKELPRIIQSLRWEILFSDMVLGQLQVKVPGIFGSQRLNISVLEVGEDASKIQVSTEMGLLTFDHSKMRKTLDKLRKATRNWIAKNQ